MIKWNEERGCWKVVVEAHQPGERRRRVARYYKAPNTTAGERATRRYEDQVRGEVQAELAKQWPGARKGGTFSAAADGWLARRQHKWSPATVRVTRYNLTKYILPDLGDVALDQLTPARVEAVYAGWDARYSPSTTRRWHGIVRAVLADAERLGEVGRNPMRVVRPAGGPAPERVHILSPAEVRAAIEHAPSPAVATFFELSSHTGARRGSILALRWRDVDLEAKTVTFAHAVALGPDGAVVKGTKANRPYQVNIAGQAVEALRLHRIRAAETALAQALGGLAELHVFSSDGGSAHWDLGYPSHAWRASCQRAGLKPCRLHDLRHFAATRMLAAGIPVRVVAERLGCTEANVIRTYSHRVATDEDARAAEILAGALA